MMKRFAAAAAVLAVQTACMTGPRPVSAPGAFLRMENPKQIWVRLDDGKELWIRGPKVYGDSLLGFTSSEGAQTEVWMPLAAIQELKTRRLSGVRTAFLAGTIAAAVGIVVVSIPTEGGTEQQRCFNEGVPCEEA